MVVRVAVIALYRAARALSDYFFGEDGAAAHRSGRYRGFEPRQRLTRVAASERRYSFEQLSVRGHAEAAEAAFLVRERAFEQRAYVFGAERLERVDDHAREQRLVYLEPRIFRRRANKYEPARLD